MTRGVRPGTLTKATLAERLRLYCSRRPDLAAFRVQDDAPLPQLLGHAFYYDLVTTAEYSESVPRDEITLPCYMWSFITDEMERSLVGNNTGRRSRRCGRCCRR